jgi:hypothetical protein
MYKKPLLPIAIGIAFKIISQYKIFYVSPQIFVLISIKPDRFCKPVGFVISSNEKSPQVIPQRDSNLCRVSRGDFSFLEMKLEENVVMEMIVLALIEVEILLFFFFRKIKD